MQIKDLMVMARNPKFLGVIDLIDMGAIDGAVETVIKGVGKEKPPSVGKKGKAKGAIYFAGFDKPMLVNAGLALLLYNVFGDVPAEKIVGQKVLLYVDKNVEFGGERTGGIRVSIDGRCASDACAPPKKIARSFVERPAQPKPAAAPAQLSELAQGAIDAIKDSQTVAQLEGLANGLADLPEAEKPAVRAAYGARLAELRKPQKVNPETGEVTP